MKWRHTFTIQIDRRCKVYRRLLDSYKAKIYSDWTDSTAVNPLTSTIPTVIKTWTLDQTDAYNIRVVAVFKIDSTGSSSTTAGNTIPAITIGINSKTWPLTLTQIIRTDYLTAVYAAESRNGDTVTAQLNTASAGDTNTTVIVKGFEIIEYCV